jgi:hypothetical protein
LPQKTIEQLLTQADEIATLYRKACAGMSQDDLPDVKIHPEGGVILREDVDG